MKIEAFEDGLRLLPETEFEREQLTRLNTFGAVTFQATFKTENSWGSVTETKIVDMLIKKRVAPIDMK